MAYQVDFLAAPLGKGAVFTVNTAVNTVDLDQCVPGTPQDLVAGTGGKTFTRGDCFTILSFGYQMPENFVMSQYQTAGGADFPFPVMYLRSGGTVILSINPFGNNGNMRVPFENVEHAAGCFVDPEKRGITDNFTLQALFPMSPGTLDKPQVSMINVPAALNGETFYVTPFIKVLHNSVLA